LLRSSERARSLAGVEQHVAEQFTRGGERVPGVTADLSVASSASAAAVSCAIASSRRPSAYAPTLRDAALDIDLARPVAVVCRRELFAKRPS